MSECYCDYETPEFYHSEVRIRSSRYLRPARCEECGHIIIAGERYEHVRSKHDGDVGVFNTCGRCLSLREWVKAHVPCFCWYHGGMREDAIETARGYAHEAPGLLFGAYRREVAIRRQRKLERQPK